MIKKLCLTCLILCLSFEVQAKLSHGLLGAAIGAGAVYLATRPNEAMVKPTPPPVTARSTIMCESSDGYRCYLKYMDTNPISTLQFAGNAGFKKVYKQTTIPRENSIFKYTINIEVGY